MCKSQVDIIIECNEVVSDLYCDRIMDIGRSMLGSLERLELMPCCEDVCGSVRRAMVVYMLYCFWGCTG